MKFQIFKPKAGTSEMDVTEFDYEQPTQNGFKMPMAHCDQKILHAPGECDYCDHYPEAQALRDWWGINFTNHNDPDRLPCPSTARRTNEVRDLWPGNVAVKGTL